MVWQTGFFDVEERLRDLSAKGDDLKRIAVLVDFAMFRAELERAVPRADGAPQVDLAAPAFGYKNHIAIDRWHGLIRGWTASHAAAHDGARLAEVIDADNTAGDV